MYTLGISIFGCNITTNNCLQFALISLLFSVTFFFSLALSICSVNVVVFLDFFLFFAHFMFTGIKFHMATKILVASSKLFCHLCCRCLLLRVVVLLCVRNETRSVKNVATISKILISIVGRL